MSESNKPSFNEKLNNMKVSRAAIVGTCLLLVAIIVVVSVAVATNRSKKNNVTVPNTSETTLPESESTETESTETSETTAPEATKPTTPTPEAPVEDKLPSFVLPVSGAVSKKHDPTLQVFSTTMQDYRVHIGLDIVTDAAAPVYSAADGTVDKVWEDPMMGHCIAIKHKGDCYTIYKNLAEELPAGISVGATVRAGQMIANVGESAMIEIAEEPHLHFEMTVADLSVDPLEYFDEKSLEALKIDASYEE